jgi:hypothetical protein
MARPKQSYIDMSAEQLVDHLLEAWPARCIGAVESETEAHRYAGKRELLENLRARMNREKETYGSATKEAI